LARSGIRVVVEDVMCEELDALIGVGWGECSPKRKGYRNGSYTRDLVTSSGRIEDIKVPRDRAGQFHTQAFERYSRYEPHIAEGLTQMFVAGTSTHKVGEVAQTLLGVAPSASTVSRLNQTLTQQLIAGVSALSKSTGVFCTWMACISAFVMATRPMSASF
jgi:putative transposase